MDSPLLVPGHILPYGPTPCLCDRETFHVELILGAVHKVRHAIFGQFQSPLPVTLCHTSRDPPRVRHTSRTSSIFSRPSTKDPDKSPLCTFSLNCSLGFLSGGFVLGSFVRKVLSGVVFVRSP